MSMIASRTIFVGNLSIYCQESDIWELFSAFGPIESIHLKTSTQGRGGLTYGFIKYSDRSCADNALQALNGKLLLGRPLR